MTWPEMERYLAERDARWRRDLADVRADMMGLRSPTPARSRDLDESAAELEEAVEGYAQRRAERSAAPPRPTHPERPIVLTGGKPDPDPEPPPVEDSLEDAFTSFHRRRGMSHD